MYKNVRETEWEKKTHYVLTSSFSCSARSASAAEQQKANRVKKSHFHTEQFIQEHLLCM